MTGIAARSYFPAIGASPRAAPPRRRALHGRARTASAGTRAGLPAAAARAASVEQKAAAGAGGHRGRAAPPAPPGAATARPCSIPAPAITGSATVHDSRCASARAKPRQRAALIVAPLRDTPGISATAWARPSDEPVERTGVAEPAARAGVAVPAAARAPLRGEHPGGARRECQRDREGSAEVLLDQRPHQHAHERRGRQREHQRERP